MGCAPYFSFVGALPCTFFSFIIRQWGIISAIGQPENFFPGVIAHHCFYEGVKRHERMQDTGYLGKRNDTKILYNFDKIDVKDHIFSCQRMISIERDLLIRKIDHRRCNRIAVFVFYGNSKTDFKVLLLFRYQMPGHLGYQFRPPSLQPPGRASDERFFSGLRPSPRCSAQNSR